MVNSLAIPQAPSQAPSLKLKNQSKSTFPGSCSPKKQIPKWCLHFQKLGDPVSWKLRPRPPCPFPAGAGRGTLGFTGPVHLSGLFLVVQLEGREGGRCSPGQKAMAIMSYKLWKRHWGQRFKGRTLVLKSSPQSVWGKARRPRASALTREAVGAAAALRDNQALVVIFFSNKCFVIITNSWVGEPQ